AAWRQRPASPRPSELEQLTGRDFRELLSELPAGSTLVEEDAVTALLLRSRDGSWQRMRKPLGFATRDVDSIGAALASRNSHVYDLSNRGDREQVSSLYTEDGVPETMAAELRPYVLRVEVWRAEGQPPLAAADAGASVTWAIIRSAPAAGKREMACPAFPNSP